MSTFPKIKLSEVAKVISGFAFKSSEFGNEGVPVLKIANIRMGDVDTLSCQRVSEENLGKLPDKYLVQRGDILISLTGSHVTQPTSVVGRVARMGASNTTFLLNQRAGKVIVQDHVRIDPSFLYFSLMDNAAKGEIASMASGAASQANVSPTQVGSLEILAPPLPIQQRIASILSAYDDLIENNTRRIAILEEMARRIFEEWFDDDRISTQAEAGLASKAVRLGHFMKFDKGLSYKGKFLREDGSSMVNLKNFDRSGGFRRDGLKFYAGDYKERHAVDPGDIVVANTDLTQAGDIVGSPAIVPRKMPTESALISHHLFAVRLNEELKKAKFFVFHLLASPVFKSYAKGHAVGTTVLGLHRDSIESFQVTLPSPQRMRDFSRTVAPMHELVEVLAEKISNLRSQRDLLLPKLVSGEIDVSDAETALEAAK
ncbi:restriction endonuclease subunit S [Phaeobacter italicus]|uniref:restriction endonuclease subunit S n=1 Tax=Phaeobacter italicus TaxID=481446 RepID=UPI001C945EC2|nr:restriction endonuclease subunit S [Phaeobacter italicus]MBY6045284.1 restriction endonuclease subunit S [Phaeobacter italicus]